MECLIPGLILVGLMIYASTRIKKASANAFAPETIETEAFVFEKADEFLNKVEPSSGLELEGYSREYGIGDAANIRQATYEVRRLAATPTVSAEVTEVIGEKRYRLWPVRREEANVAFIERYKMAESAGGVVQLKVTLLEDANDDVGRRVETILSGFIVK